VTVLFSATICREKWEQLRVTDLSMRLQFCQVTEDGPQVLSDNTSV